MHHFQPDNFYFYLFVVLAPLLVITIIYLGLKIVDQLEARRSDKNSVRKRAKVDQNPANSRDEVNES